MMAAAGCSLLTTICRHSIAMLSRVILLHRPPPSSFYFKIEPNPLLCTPCSAHSRPSNLSAFASRTPRTSLSSHPLHPLHIRTFSTSASSPIAFVTHALRQGLPLHDGQVAIRARMRACSC